MSVARFPVTGQLDSAGARKDGTVTIDRETGMIAVRPKRSQQVYEMPLDVVATWICQTTLAARVREQKIAKKAQRAGRG